MIDPEARPVKCRLRLTALPVDIDQVAELPRPKQRAILAHEPARSPPRC